MMPPPLPNSGLQYPPEPTPFTVDSEVLKPGVIHDLEEVQDVWSLSGSSLKLPIRNDLLLEGANHRQSPEFDVLAVLKITTRAISFRSNSLEAFDIILFLARIMRVSPSRLTNTSQSAPIPLPQVSTVPLPPDPLSLIRRAALDVLTVLRGLEEHSRLPMTDDAYDIASTGSGSGNGISRNPSPTPFGIERTTSPTALSGDDDTSDVGGTSRFGSSPSSPRPKQPKSPRPEIIPLKVQGWEKVVPVWSDPAEDIFFDDDEEQSKKDAWDDRLVLGGGWLYRSDIDPATLTKEREVVGRYLDVVDGVLFGNTMPATPGQRGWQRAKLEPAAKNRGKSPRSSFGSSDGSPRKASGGSRRAVSAVLLDAMSELTLLTEEPESMDRYHAERGVSMPEGFTTPLSPTVVNGQDSDIHRRRKQRRSSPLFPSTFLSSSDPTHDGNTHVASSPTNRGLLESDGSSPLTQPHANGSLKRITVPFFRYFGPTANTGLLLRQSLYTHLRRAGRGGGEGEGTDQAGIGEEEMKEKQGVEWKLR